MNSFRHPLAAAILLGMSSCTVYAPVQPQLPVITGRGQAEASVSLQTRLGANLAYSPLPHVLLTGAGTWRPQISHPATNWRHTRAAELGVGTYWGLGRAWWVQGLVGQGWGNTARDVSDGGFVQAFHDLLYARYTTRFGQLGVVHQGEHGSFGVGYRLVRLRYENLRSSFLELPSENQLRHEPFLFVRRQLNPAAPGTRWYVEGTSSLSLGSPGRVSGEAANRYAPDVRRSNLNRGGAWLLGVGLVVQPSWGRVQ